MAEEVEMTPVEMTPVDAAEPPKADPLAKPAEPKPATLKLDPVPQKPAAGAAASGALKPGLKLPPKPTLGAGIKLPPKPGAGTAALKPGLKLPTQNALRPGLKLPPKPGAPAAGLKPGLNLPPKPGVPVAKPDAPQAAVNPASNAPAKPGATQTMLKPGVRLPPRPVIHKPGESGVAPAVPKPVIPKPVVPAAASPAPAAPAPAAEASKPEVPSPAPVAVDAQGVGKLPTVEAKAIARDNVTPVVAPGPTPLEQLQSVTHKLKGITQEIPQQAILRKTGIIAEDAMSEAQKAAAKHKTARISLSDAMGVAPVKNENAPLKTIRIKRPVDLQASASSPKAQTASESGSAEPATEQVAASPAEAEGSKATVTQRKTLKIARPGGAVRPAGKFGVKRPAASSATTVKASAPEGAAEAADAPVADIPDMADIPDIQSMPTPNVPSATVEQGSALGWTISALVQAAACVAIGALAWFLYQNSQTQYF